MRLSPAASLLTFAFFLALTGAGFAPKAEALANCSAQPAPGVDWSRCVFGEVAYEEADLSGARLVGARLKHSAFPGSNFTEVEARGAKFVSSDLKGARFDKADLTDADMTKADLQGASFKGTKLRRTRLFRANLKGADFTDANLDQTDFLHADLTGATWTDGKHVCGEGSIGRCK